MINKNLKIEKQNIINLFNQKKFNKISKISPKILVKMNTMFMIKEIIGCNWQVVLVIRY